MAWQVVETQEVARLYPIHTKWVCLSLLFLPAHAWVWNGAFQDLYSMMTFTCFSGCPSRIYQD